MSVVRRALDAATHPAVVRHQPAQRAWRRVLAARRLPDGERARLARAVAQRLRDAGDVQGAEQVFASTAPTLRDPAAAADLAWSAADLALSRGVAPAGLDDTLRRVLAAPGADQLSRAFALAFHRTLHFDAPTSPLAEDPAGFLAPLRESAVFRRAAERRAGRREPAAAPPADRPHRLLFVSYKNFAFLTEILAHYEAMSGVEVRRLDLGELTGLPLSPAQQSRLRLTGADDARSLPWAAPIAEAIDWADTVWVEWGQRGASLVSMLDPGRARVVVRLHSFEAFTPFPHLVDWSRVDDLVFVGDHVRALTEAVVAVPESVRRSVIPNHAALAGYRRDKPASARHTMALVGWGTPAKDAPWALDVLARLRADDDRWRLRLIGAEPAEALPRYRAAVESQLGPGVEQVGWVDDVATALQDVGVILSTSTRESFHLGLMEGAASGAVPVVRDWPVFAPYGGARALVPDAWVVDSVESAAARVRACCADETAWRADGAAAAAYVVEHYDWSVVAPRLDAFLLGGG